MQIVPDVLYDDIKSGNCVLFVGAGVSTEGGTYGEPTLYDTIRKKVGITDDEDNIPFPDLMQLYCDKIDGGHRNRLTREIISRIEMFSMPGEGNLTTTLFHSHAAEIPYFNRIVTTNWDTFLEQNMNVLVPMVEDRDIPFWDDSKRQIIKIHGCVTRPYTIIATRMDYNRCLDTNPFIINKLKDLMATKTFIYVGFSMLDPDFHILIDEMIARLGDFKKLSYAIDPCASTETTELWKSKRVKIIKAYGIRFIYELRDRLVADGILVSQDYLMFMEAEESRMREEHTRLHDGPESDGAFASAMYQDGVLNQLYKILSKSRIGYPKDAFKSALTEEETFLDEAERDERLIDIAYHIGRIEVLRRFLSNDLSPIPTFFHPQKLVPIHKFVKRDA